MTRSRGRLIGMAVMFWCLTWAAGCRTLGTRGRDSDARSASVSGQSDGSVSVDASVLRASADMRPTAASSVNLHLDLARGLDSQGQFERANEAYLRALSAYREQDIRSVPPADRARLHRRLGAAFDRTGKPHEAQSHYRAAQKLAPKEPEVWNDSGYSAYLQGNWAEAERLFRKALALDRNDARAATNLGLTLTAMGRADEALAVMTPVVGEAAAHANVAYILASQGEHEQARGHYHKALAIKPDLAVARRGLAALKP